MVHPKRVLSSEDAEHGERIKRQNSGELRFRVRRLSSEEEEYTTDETSEDEAEATTQSAGRKSKPPRRWQPHEDRRLAESVKQHGEANWKAIAAKVGSRNHVQCLQRWKKVLRPGLVKGQWSKKEDAMLMKLASSGYKNWGVLSNHMPGRTSKQCRERWCHHLDPSINKGAYTPQEDKIIIETQAKIGNRWSQIAALLPGRTENSIKIRCKALQRKVSGSSGRAGSNAQGARASKRSASSSSQTRRRQSSSSSFASATSGVSAADSIPEQESSEAGDEQAEGWPTSPTVDLKEGIIGREKREPASFVPRTTVQSSFQRSTSFNTPQQSFYDPRVGADGQPRLQSSASFPPAHGTTLRASTSNAILPATAAGAPSVDPGGSSWWWPCMRTPATVESTQTPMVMRHSGYADMAEPAMIPVKDELAQQHAPTSGINVDFPSVERSSVLGDRGCRVMPSEKATVTDAAFTTSPPYAFGTHAQPFNSSFNTVHVLENAGPPPHVTCVNVPPSDPGLAGVGFAATVSPGFTGTEASSTDLDRGGVSTTFGDFNSLSMDDLKAAVGGPDDNDAAAPLRSCCSFLDLPEDEMVVGDMPLPW